MHKAQKQTDINGLLTKLQKPTTFFLFGVMILMFVYSLIFITPFYKNIYKTDGEMSNADLNKYGINIEDYDSSIWTLKDSTSKGTCILVKEKNSKLSSTSYKIEQVGDNYLIIIKGNKEMSLIETEEGTYALKKFDEKNAGQKEECATWTLVNIDSPSDTVDLTKPLLLINKDSKKVFSVSENNRVITPGEAYSSSTDYSSIAVTLVKKGDFYQMKFADGTYVRNTKVSGLNIELFTSIARENGELQVFNHWMFTISFFGILASCLLFVYYSQKRKRYYITNFVVMALVIAFDIYIGCSLIGKLSNIQGEMNSLNYGAINALISSKNLSETLVEYVKASDFNWIFSLGYVVASAILVAAACAIILVVLKLVYQIKNKPIDTSEVKINE